ncbi:ABC transporter permease [Alkalihalobacillus sp. BA299]|uniref:ABC transporter permease n=1 Tax=Alkalihalobacillus sp. BA299 TaxID=2815938 RepID=UPI001AD9FA90|nr:ABC transporter permease [Alkalihalobacillus sp. BA299]
MVKKILNKIIKYQSIFILFILWEIIAITGVFPERLFPSFFTVAGVSFDIATSSMFWDNLSVTMYRVIVGFTLAAVIGVPIGLMMSRYNVFNTLIQPMLSIGYPIPRVALYPILVFILGIGSGSKILLITLECLFPIVISTYYGALRVNHLYIWASQNMGANDRKMFWKVLLPATTPAIFTGLRMAVPLALIIAILTEMISSTEGMGYLLVYLSSSLVQETVLAMVLLIGVVGYLLSTCLDLVQNRFIFWK